MICKQFWKALANDVIPSNTYLFVLEGQIQIFNDFNNFVVNLENLLYWHGGEVTNRPCAN